MYNPQDTAERIKEIAKKKNIAISKILTENSIGKGTITKMKNGSDVFVQTIYKIAKSLNCSLDYLVGNNSGISEEEQELLEDFRKVTIEGKNLIKKQASYIADDKQYQKYTDVPKEA